MTGREKFEIHATKLGLASFLHYELDNKQYSNIQVQNLWKTWQAAILAQEPREAVELLNIALTKLKELPRFSFLSPNEGGVRRFADKSGNWIEQYEAVKIIDDLIYEPLYTSPPSQANHE